MLLRSPMWWAPRHCVELRQRGEAPGPTTDGVMEPASDPHPPG